MREDFDRRVSLRPAYDHILNPCSEKCATPGGSHGRHGVDLHFTLVGSHGATEFVVYTMWQLGWVVSGEWGKRVKPDTPLPVRAGSRPVLHGPMASWLGYHWTTPTYEGEEPARRDCLLVSGAVCYADGSGLNAEPVFARLIEEGDAGVWAALEEYYAGLAVPS